MAFNLVRRLEDRLEDFFDDRLFLERLDRVDLLEDLDSKEEMDARAVSGGDSCMGRVFRYHWWVDRILRNIFVQEMKI